MRPLGFPKKQLNFRWFTVKSLENYLLRVSGALAKLRIEVSIASELCSFRGLSRMDRKTYWNEAYYEYWKRRTEEGPISGPSAIVPGDVRTQADDVYGRVFAQIPFAEGRLLDVGCAWGRLFPLYLERPVAVHGVDISSAMITAARDAWAGHDRIEYLGEAEAEALPFENGYFQNVVCIAVFDATNQSVALEEFFRVLAPRGFLYLTGKNTHYHRDDDLAISAEEGARRKGHPNFFTDYERMIAQINAAGHEVVASWRFARRGDFSTFTVAAETETLFYEWFVVVRKCDSDVCNVFQPFSSDVSRTFGSTGRP